MMTFLTRYYRLIFGIVLVLGGCATPVTASQTASGKPEVINSGTGLSPDEVAMVLGTMIVANKQCGLEGNEFPLNVAVAKLGRDLVDFEPDSRYAPLVDVKMRKALELVSAWGKPRACKAMQEVLFKFLPDIYKKSR